mgnify:FL=1
MSAHFPTYALALPSGRHVLVRRPDGAALLGAGALLFPLLSRAIAVAGAGGDDDATPAVTRPLDAVRRYCETCLVSPRMPGELAFEDIPFSDARAIYEWAVLDWGDAIPMGTAPHRPQDFVTMVGGEGAFWLDLVAHRYHQRPSQCLGVSEVEWALDLDLAVAYRALRRDSDAAGGEIEVDDIFGDKHKVPRKWLAQEMVEPGGRVVKADALARTHGVGTPLSIGGIGGDARLGAMPTPGSMIRQQY